MPVIGTFSAHKDGYAGTIRTLMVNGRVKFLANERKESEGAPDFRIVLGSTDIGAAWRRTNTAHLLGTIDGCEILRALEHEINQPFALWCHRRH
jgi:uncharacterized protein (DUF736 family)